VMRLIEEPSFRDNARRMADRFAEVPGPQLAAELLERLAKEAPAPATAA
jgi:UDP:flavonoid glycosyltransferase YjiC (YdhE family)